MAVERSPSPLLGSGALRLTLGALACVQLPQLPPLWGCMVMIVLGMAGWGLRWRGACPRSCCWAPDGRRCTGTGQCRNSCRQASQHGMWWSVDGSSICRTMEPRTPASCCRSARAANCHRCAASACRSRGTMPGVPLMAPTPGVGAIRSWPARSGIWPCACGRRVRGSIPVVSTVNAMRCCAACPATARCGRRPARVSQAAHGLPAWRERTSAAIAAQVAHPAARFVQALALGDTRGSSDADWDQLRALGLTHLVAISGFHVGVVAGLGALLCRGLWWLCPLLARHWPRPRRRRCRPVRSGLCGAGRR